jgi:glycosyltransferase involved in cell wall biosynthesis
VQLPSRPPGGEQPIRACARSSELRRRRTIKLSNPGGNRVSAVHALRVLTWHIHGGYLWYLAHARHEFYVPVKDGHPPGYVGLPAGGYPWPANLHEVPADQVPSLDLDCILFQTRQNLLHDQYELLSTEQQRLPRIYLEHDPPCEHPTNTRHVVDDPSVLLVHVTPFNALMWDSGRTPVRVIEHGVTVPEHVRYHGRRARGLVVVNNLRRRGRRLGADVFEQVRARVPLDLVGMAADELDGLGEVPHDLLPEFEAQYRVFFNPIRYTSLGLAICEAMMVGMPVVGLATAELATVIENHVSGFVDTDVERLIDVLNALLADPAEARRLGAGARKRAQERFGIDRFAADWEDAIQFVAGSRLGATAVGVGR